MPPDPVPSFLARLQALVADPLTWGLGLGVLLLLAAAAWLAGTGTAFAAAPRARLRARAERGSANARRALALLEAREARLGTLLLFGHLATLGATVLMTLLLVRLCGRFGGWLALPLMLFLVMVLVEHAPRARALADPERRLRRGARVFAGLVRLAAPPLALCRGLARGGLRLAGRPVGPGPMLAPADALAGAFARGAAPEAAARRSARAGAAAGTPPGTAPGTVAEPAPETAAAREAREARHRLLGMLELGERSVEEIMLHRSQIQMIDADASPPAILSAVLNSAHTRLPLYRGERENIVGILHAKDMLRAVEAIARDTDGGFERLRGLDVTAMAMPAYFIPETTPLDEQLRAFLKRRTHFALVVDEYGDLQGLITLEDILEEIVGEIADEFDPQREKPIRALPDGSYLVEGTVTIRDLNRALDWSLPDDEANTIAGLVIHEAQTIPAEGQVFSFHGRRFEVVSRKENRLARLKIRKLSA